MGPRMASSIIGFKRYGDAVGKEESRSQLQKEVNEGERRCSECESEARAIRLVADQSVGSSQSNKPN